MIEIRNLKSGRYCVRVNIPMAHLRESHRYQIVNYWAGDSRVFVLLGDTTGKSISVRSVDWICKVKRLKMSGNIYSLKH